MSSLHARVARRAACLNQAALLVCSILLAASGKADGGIINARSAAYADVSAALSLAGDGDTLAIPQGTATWTRALSTNKAITLQGAGVGKTIIVDDLSTDEGLVALQTAAGKAYRVTGIEFRKGSKTTAQVKGIINVVGSSSSVRLDSCKFDHPRNMSIRFGGYVRGLVDHNYFVVSNSSQFINIWAQDWAGGVWGDKSWSTDVDWGGPNAIYIEDNTFVGDGVVAGVTDTYAGARIVFRYNQLNSATVSSHGTGDGAGRNRGPAQWEIYGNTWNTTPSTGKNALHIRGGSVRFFLNTINGHGKGLTLHHYRLCSVKGKFGNADGLNLFDIPDKSDGSNTPGGAGDGVFASGLAGSGSGNLKLVVPGAGWAPNQWVGYIVNVPVSSLHPEGTFCSVVSGNTSDTITVLESHQPPLEKPFKAGEKYEMRRILLALDMVGSGKADLLTDTSVDPRPVNLHQTREPCYTFSNTLNGKQHFTVAQPGIVENYHYFNQLASTFNGSAGVGVGTRAQMNAITPNREYVAFWVTDEGEWNSTNGAAPDGRLYVSNGNSWVLKYTPYRYPHALATGSTVVNPPPPLPPTDLRVISTQ